MEENPLFLIPLIILGFPIAFGSIWIFVMFINANLSGWRRLSEKYRSTRPFTGQTYRFQSARINWANYSGVLDIGVNEEGLRLQPFMIFRPFHPALFIPWYDIEAEDAKTIFKMKQLIFPSVPGVKIRLPMRTFKVMAPYLKERVW